MNGYAEEFQNYIKSLQHTGAMDIGVSKQASVAPAAVQAPVVAPTTAPQAPVANTNANMQSKVASAILDAEQNLSSEIKEAADTLAFLEAFNQTKQANYINEKVEEFTTMSSQNLAMDPNYNPLLAQPQWQPQQKFANVGQAANAMYANAYQQQAHFEKVASEAQSFVDAIYAKNFQAALANECALWSNYAQQANG